MIRLIFYIKFQVIEEAIEIAVTDHNVEFRSNLWVAESHATKVDRQIDRQKERQIYRQTDGDRQIDRQTQTDRQTQSDIVRHSQTQSKTDIQSQTDKTDIDRHRQTQTDIDRHRKIQTDIDRHSQTQSDIVSHSQTQSDIVRHSQTQTDIVRHSQSQTDIYNIHTQTDIDRQAGRFQNYICIQIIVIYLFEATVVKGMRRHARGRFGMVEYKYMHYFIRLEEGPPPKKYFDKVSIYNFH